MSVYDIEIKTIDGGEKTLAEYEGKVLLIVNTATGCGFTPQYEGLQALYEKYAARGFEILDFPCNQFGRQAPGTDEEIGSFCSLNYKTTFPRFKKIDVNGKDAAPLYTYLKSQKGGFLGGNIKWNFTKFLVDRGGNVVARFAPTETPQALDEKIAALL